MLLNPDWDVPDCGRTGYEYALYEGSQEVCEFLINHLDFNINTLTETGVHILEIDAELRDCTLDTDIMNHDDFSWESTSNKTIPLIALLEDLCPEELEEVLEENPHVNGRYRIKGRERGWY